MNAHGNSSGQSSTPGYCMHIHNYSSCAIQSLILEIKKYPIIFNGIAVPPVTEELINMAWAKIVSSLLPNLNLEKIKYWDRSFREAWKWMRSVLVQDMSERRSDLGYIRNPRDNWLNQLKFVEPFIQFNEISSIELDYASAESEAVFVDLRATSTVVISVRDSTEPSCTDDMHISICFRVTESSFMGLNENPVAIELGPQQGGDVSVIPANQAGSIPPNFIQNEASMGYLPIEGVTPMMTDGNLSEIDFFDQLHEFGTVVQSSVEGLPPITYSLPQQPEEPSSCVAKYEEDYRYIMSLLPKVKRLDPTRKVEVKKLIMQAALSLLTDKNKLMS